MYLYSTQQDVSCEVQKPVQALDSIEMLENPKKTLTQFFQKFDLESFAPTCFAFRIGG